MTNLAEEPASSSRSRRPDDAMLALVVEDDLGQQAVMRSTLEGRGMRVLTAASGFEALRTLAVQDPQLVTLDLGLPDFDGVELCKRIRRTHRCPIIIVSADDDEARMVAALDVGADDYVTKPYAPDVLMARVRVALRHVAALAGAAEQTTFRVGDLFLDVEAHVVLADGEPVEVSPRQFRLLTALMRNPGRVLTHRQLVMVSSTDEQHLDATTNGDGLRGAISHLRNRLGTGPQRPRIVNEPQVGYRLLPPS